MTLLSSNSDGTQTPPHHEVSSRSLNFYYFLTYIPFQRTETTDSNMDVEPVMAEPHSTIHAGSSPLATLRTIAQANPLPSANVPSQPAPTTSPSQLTTTMTQAQPSSTSSMSTPSVGSSFMPQWNRTQTTGANAPPPCITTGAAPLTTANVSAHAPFDNVVPPSTISADVIRDAIVGTTRKPLPPAPTTAGVRGSDEPPTCSTSTSYDKVRMLLFLVRLRWLTF